MNTMTAPTKEGHLVLGSSEDALTVCVLDDEQGMVEMLQESLRCLGFSSVGTCDPQYALDLIDQGRVRVVMSDIKMPGMDGLHFLEHALHHDPGVYVILMTGFYSLDNAIAAIKRGAYDYIPKPVDRSRLKKSLDELSDSFHRRKRIRTLEHQLLNDLEFHGIVGRSPAMIEVFEMVRKVARHYTNILLVGATGTGKELIAKSIHKISPVAAQRSRFATVPPWWTHFWRASSSAISAGPSRARPIRALGCSNTPTAEPSSSTKSERHRWRCKPNCSV